MSDTTPPPARGTEPTDGSRLTVEDVGSTTHAADLFHNDTTTAAARPASTGSDEDLVAVAERVDRPEAVAWGDDRSGSVPAVPVASDAPPEPAGPSAPGAPEAPSAPSGGLGALAGDDSIAHVFDQTNGMLDRFDGDSDGTADSDVHSAAERADENPAFERYAATEVPSSGDSEDTRATGN
jgi:hypothetical protein